MPFIVYHLHVAGNAVDLPGKPVDFSAEKNMTD
jgi:hypothetical protein